MSHTLEQLKRHTVVVADTGDFLQLAQFAPRDATTNPSLILKAVQKAEYAPLLTEVVQAHRGAPLEEVVDHVLVRFGLEILRHVPGRVSTEVDARLSFDTAATIARAQRLIAMYEAAGIGPEDVDIAQLQDTDAGAEVIHMAETGLCADGEQEKLLADGATEIHGSIPVNTDGGLIANGEPIGASGLRQMHELVRQLRGEAGDRQVPGQPRVGLAQVYGAPGTASATVLSL